MQNPPVPRLSSRPCPPDARGERVEKEKVEKEGEVKTYLNMLSYSVKQMAEALDDHLLSIRPILRPCANEEKCNVKLIQSEVPLAAELQTICSVIESLKFKITDAQSRVEV